MIFILIAGSYAPFCLISLNGFKGWILFGVEILIAVLGVSFKLIWLLVGGGVFYTIGAIIYGTKPEFLKLKKLEFHEIFHIFILLGSLCQYLCVLLYVI